MAILISILLFSNTVCTNAVPLTEQHPKNYYVSMASLNLFSYVALYVKENNFERKKYLAEELAFISFVYFVQKEQGILNRSNSYEKALRNCHKTMLHYFEADHIPNPYLDPCVWKEGAQEAKHQMADVRKMSHTEYKEMVANFLNLLEE